MTDRLQTRAPAATASQENTTAEPWLQIREALRGLIYGSVNIIVQDGVVIQIDRTEKRRTRSNPLKSTKQP